MSSGQKKYKLTRRIATAALIMAAALFGASLWMLGKDPGNTLWAGLKAFSEAAMVGALADWFAVVALFRHPLGLPIPHTAVLVKGRERVADAIAIFVSDNFLTAEVLVPKIMARKPALSLANWSSSRKNAEKVMEFSSEFIPILRRFLESDGIRQFLKSNITPLLQEFPLARTAAIALRNIRNTPAADNMIDKLAEEALSFVRDNKTDLEQQVAEQLPIPAFMDIPPLKLVRDKIAGKIAPLVIEKLDSYLYDVGIDRRHPLRCKIRDHMGAIADRLETDPEFARSFEQAKNSLLASDTLDMIVSHLLTALQKGVIDDLLTPGSSNYRQAVIGIRRLGKGLKDSPPVQGQIDSFLAELVSTAATRYHGQIREEIRTVVLGWDVQDMISRIEEQVGADLQFIRLNGTLVGGIVGLVLFFITILFQ